jgi:hypothetical protein
LLPALPPM